MRSLVGRNYSDMSERYRGKTSREQFKADRKVQRKAGDIYGQRIGQEPGTVNTTDFIDNDGDAIDDRNQARPGGVDMAARDQYFANAPKVEDINDYDTTAFGAGSSSDTDRLSRADLRALKHQGFSKQDIIDYSAEKVAGGSLQGSKAQALLDKWTNSLKGTTPEPDPTPDTTPTPEPDASVDYDPTPVPEPTPGDTNIGGGGGYFPPMPSTPVFQFPQMPTPVGPGGPGGFANNNTFINNSNQQINNSNNTIGDGSNDNYINNGQYNYGGHSMINNLTF